MTLSPIMKRRLWQFKTNKRGYYSSFIFLIIMLITIGAPFIANERPLIVYYKNSFYFPIFKDHPETVFGGTFETCTNFHDHSVSSEIKKNGWLLFPPIPFSAQTVNYDLNVPAPSPPSCSNWLGTDDQGRDVLARLLYGMRTSILFGLTLTFFSTIIGIIVGAIQGYFGGKIDLIGQRILEVWSGIPMLFLLIILSSMIEPNIVWLLGILLLFTWIPLVSVVRAEFFKTRSLEYVKAAEALGVAPWRIIIKHMLPNAMVAAITYIPFMLNAAIALLTSLDFLGFGLPPGSASLGELITQGKNNIQAYWLGLTAFFSISVLLSLLIFIGEAIRDAFDTRKIYGQKL